MKNNLLKKCLFLLFLAIILLLVISIMVKYDEEGEKTLPFSISKVLIVSTVNGHAIDDPENIWNISIEQVNDIYMYIDKTSDKDDIIKEIKFNNFIINKKPELGELKLLRPTGELSNLYNQSEQNYLDSEIIYSGGLIDDMKALEISNTGGILGFRFALENLGTYISNENEEINYDGRLLSNLGITDIQKLQFNVSFDVTIKTSKNISYNGNNKKVECQVINCKDENKYYYSETNTCYDSYKIPENTYYNPDNQNSDENTLSSCFTKISSIEYTTGFFYVLSNCPQQCPDNFYYAGNNKCRKCHPLCDTCFADGTNQNNNFFSVFMYRQKTFF